MKRIQKGDHVIVTAGRSKGQRGHVLRVLGEDRMLVENVNMIKKHQKPNPSANQAGGIIEKESSIHVSNLQMYNPVTDKGDRVGFKTLDDGRKVRIYRSTGEAIDI
jgi:large subunit ribosomal protein L24